MAPKDVSSFAQLKAHDSSSIPAACLHSRLHIWSSANNSPIICIITCVIHPNSHFPLSVVEDSEEIKVAPKYAANYTWTLKQINKYHHQNWLAPYSRPSDIISPYLLLTFARLKWQNSCASSISVVLWVLDLLISDLHEFVMWNFTPSMSFYLRICEI